VQAVETAQHVSAIVMPAAGALFSPEEPGAEEPGKEVSDAEEKGDLDSLRQELEHASAREISRNEVALRTVPDGLVISLREVGFF
jgi:hypothetical protein